MPAAESTSARSPSDARAIMAMRPNHSEIGRMRCDSSCTAMDAGSSAGGRKRSHRGMERQSSPPSASCCLTCMSGPIREMAWDVATCITEASSSATAPN
eukprot:scaffold181821_cov29-Tisochrysis_lutea.AAC.6